MKKVYWIIIPVVIGVVSCAPLKMSVDEALKPVADEYTVKGRQGIMIRQKLGFGEFNTSVVKRSWTKGSSSGMGFGMGQPGDKDYTNIISIENTRRKQTVFFSLYDGNKNVSEVYCSAQFKAKDITIGKTNNIVDIALDLLGKGGHSESSFYVQIYTAPDQAPWQMLIDNQAAHASARTYTGVLAMDKAHYYTLVPVTRLEKNGKSGNTLMGSVGFEFRDTNGKAVAAVSLIDNGMVILGKTNAAERFLLANACAALLLQQEIE